MIWWKQVAKVSIYIWIKNNLFASNISAERTNKHTNKRTY